MSITSTAVPAAAGAAVSHSRRTFGYLMVASVLFLIWWGGQVKSNQAGLSVPDWPKGYGTWWPPLVGNVFWEWLHRVIAAAVGVLAILMGFWTARVEPRAWVRRLAWGLLAAIVVQGLLGGLNVTTLLFLPITFAHSTLAQLILCMAATLAYAGSIEGTSVPGTPVHRADVKRVGRAARIALVGVFIQLLLGVTVRHREAGMAVPFFPVSANGEWVPEFVNPLVVIHMAHRAFALVVLVVIVRAALIAARAWRVVTGQAMLMCGLVVAQIFMGGVIVWSGKSAVPTSFHVVVGASLLALCWLLVLRSHRMGRGAATP